MPKVSAGLACPYCDAQGVSFELYQVTPEPMLRCESNNPQHIFNDISVLKAMNPRRLMVKPPPEKPQAGHVPLTVSVPAHTVDALKTKFGDRLSNSVSSVLQACAEGRMTILNTVELERLEEKLGPGINSAAELFGRVFALKEELKQTSGEYEKLLRKLNVKRTGGDEIQVELGDFQGKAMQMAAESGQDVSEFLSKYIQNSLENDWITVS